MVSETPPRAWGRLKRAGEVLGLVRNTPTGVGKTFYRGIPINGTGKHPHGRGEDRRYPSARRRKCETPPRAWGRRDFIHASLFREGNTPTGVGKTAAARGRLAYLRKHPHGRGEDVKGEVAGRGGRETPPRAWGRPALLLPKATPLRNTPTGVGKTIYPHQISVLPRKHPHGRGEDQDYRQIILFI